jgi:DNA-binding winged helix-turn-helix (wHTH) protein
MRYAFGRFEFDPSQSTLLRERVALPARPKVLALLADLIERRGRLVYKKELSARLWPDVNVGPTSLSTLVGETRALIEDTGQRQAWIRTELGRGYRFVGPVRIALDFGEPTPANSLAELAFGHARLDVIRRFETNLGLLSRGRTRLLAIVGTAGSGKSRLMSELLSMARGRGFLTAVGSCPKAIESPSLWPWIEILRCFVQEDEAKQLPSLIGPDLLALVRCQPDALGWLSAGGRGALGQVRFRVFDCIRRFLAERAQRSPCVIVLEHLQRADPGTLSLIDHLVSQLEEIPLMLAVSVRSEGRSHSHPDDETLRRFRDSPISEIIPISPLDPGALAANFLAPRPRSREAGPDWENTPLDGGRSFSRYSVPRQFGQGNDSP